jgi:aconitate hydratase
MNVVEKILSEHLVSGELVPGTEISIKIDQSITQDATGTMAYLQFESMGLDRVKADLAVSYVDHNTIQVGFENADDHDYLRTVAKKYGVVFSKPGNGICHQLHLERFGAPGKTLLGADSHTPTGGGIGMIAIGAGGIDVAVAMGGGEFFLTAPKVIKVNLTGKLSNVAKDVILKVLEIISTKGNVGCMIEYAGEGVKTLDVPSRATITNMGAECGVTTSVFPSDKVTKQFLEAQGRGDVWKELKADDDAEYARVIDIDLSELEPRAACPHSPGNIATIQSLKGTKVNQVLIGSCTNSSYRDLKTVALMLKGRKVSPDVSVGIAPGSRQVVTMLAEEGLLGELIASGVRILENTCGFCIGNSMSPSTDAVSLRTSNRNFEARSGTKSAQLYLVSPETAAAAALTGEFTDPRELGFEIPTFEIPSSFEIEDSMFLYQDTKSVGVPGTEVLRGPNIADVPKAVQLVDSFEGVATIKVGDKITTDHIMPAGARLKYRSNIPEYSKYVFENTDPEFYANASANRDKGLANFIVAGESYGQGSSREHAALCPMYLGVKALIAKSVERIHYANLINFGIIPFVFENDDDYDKITQGDSMKIEGLLAALDTGKATLKLEDGTDVPLLLSVSERQKGMLKAGGLLNTVK